MQCSDEPKSVFNNIKSNVQTPASRLLRTAIVGSLVTGLSVAPQALLAQEGKRASSALLEEVVVTARKREESSQDVPLAISAFNSDQLSALKVRDLESLSVGSPNVSLDDAGTTAGYANFSIRGQGINSSIVSIDPTVGVFVDGIYLGIPAGQVFDLFDLQSIEVLRGPQGTLFGRNVTGGAILINTALPGDEFDAYVKGSVDGGGDGGLNSIVQGSVSGPLSETFAAKISLYYNDDEGYFENLATGDDFGAATQEVVRLAGVWTPTDTVEVITRYQYQENDGDGPASQSHTNGFNVPGEFERDSFDFSIDEEGFAQSTSNLFSVETNFDVGFGDGTITNIFGYRDYSSETLGDIDAIDEAAFHSQSWTEAEQFSNELRYTGTFADFATVTVGAYYFTNDVEYHERRNLGQTAFEEGIVALGGAIDIQGNGPAVFQDGGGLYDVTSASLFGSVDWDLTSNLVLTTGLRFTTEEKEVRIATLGGNTSGPLVDELIALQGGNVTTSTCNIVVRSEGNCVLDFEDEEDWSYVSPKLGLTYHINDSAHVYGHISRGIRSGGYNLRNTAVDVDPGPFDEETTDAFELGYKATYSRGRLNAALFYNEISDQQREINLPSASSGTVQIIQNTADATILGLEIDGAFSVTPSFLLTGSIGWLEAEYDEVFFNLFDDPFTGDVGEINSADLDLELPRAPELTYSVGANYDVDIGSAGYLSSRISFAHRDESAYTDNNRGFITEQDILDIGFDFYSADDKWSVGIYFNNLLDEVKHGGDTQLGGQIDLSGSAGLNINVPTGATFAPLAKGRIIGAEFTYNF